MSRRFRIVARVPVKPGRVTAQPPSVPVTPAGVPRQPPRARRGFTAVELVVVCALMCVLCAIAVPSAVGSRRALGADAGARHLALVLREAQARAQSGGARTAVQVAPDGTYEVALQGHESWRVTEQGKLLTAVTTNYPGGRVEFGRAGWPLSPGTVTPRAGSFVLGPSGRSRTVVLQLTGCVRCR